MIVKHPREYVVDKLQYALNPKTIAVVGASRYSTKVGYKVVDGLLTWGYKGKIYPVNPRADKVAGFTAYKTVKDIPDEIDLAFLAVPAHIVKSVLKRKLRLLLLPQVHLKKSDVEHCRMNSLNIVVIMSCL